MMRLSEAIRLGSMLKPHGFGFVALRADHQTSCAFEAAKEASGGKIDESVDLLWPFLKRLTVCPECGSKETHGAGIISVHLNDNHRWTRERIADWVETIEPKEKETNEQREPSDRATAIAS